MYPYPSTTSSANIRTNTYSLIHFQNFVILQAEEYIDTFQYELAQKFCERALTMDSDNLRALETSGTLLLELEQMEKAKAVSFKMIKILGDSCICGTHLALFYVQGISFLYNRITVGCVAHLLPQ